MTLLATLLHVSDVHFGKLDYSTGDASLDAEARNWWRRHKVLDGFLGHSARALIHLQACYEELCRTEALTLVVTGDLTTCGHPEQFGLARAYFEASFGIRGAGNTVGLRLRDALKSAIPGNHDHWPGRRTLVGPSTPALAALFPAPLGTVEVPLSGDRKLLLLRIDSDADVAPIGASRVAARGDFISQLQSLHNRLPPPHPDEIRVLLLHHSPMRGEGALGTKERSLRALDQFVKEQDIAVMLTGHVHTAEAKLQTIRDVDGEWTLLEARCGTTLQRDSPPLEWALTAEEIAERFNKNTLLVHRLHERVVDGAPRIEWDTTWYVRTARGFRPQGRLWAEPPVVVWPRP